MPDSRSLLIPADRFGFTGTGGGGAGDSIEMRVLWRALRVSSSSLRARDLDVLVMALDCGLMCNGKRVKVSTSSIFAIIEFLLEDMFNG